MFFVKHRHFDLSFYIWPLMISFSVEWIKPLKHGSYHYINSYFWAILLTLDLIGALDISPLKICNSISLIWMSSMKFVCLFVLGFNVSLTSFQSYCDGTCIRQVIVLSHWNTPVAGTWQEHTNQSDYKLSPGRPAIIPSSHLSMPSVSKGAACTII